jgi:hypothetical protein
MKDSSLNEAEETQERENILEPERNKRMSLVVCAEFGAGVGLIFFEANDWLMKRKYKIRRSSIK